MKHKINKVRTQKHSFIATILQEKQALYAVGSIIIILIIVLTIYLLR